jgi:hypothetical protein
MSGCGRGRETAGNPVDGWISLLDISVILVTLQIVWM